MEGAEPIEWAMKNEEECDFAPEAPNTKGKEGNPLKVNPHTPEQHQLKLEINQHHKDKQRHKNNKTAACGHTIGQCTQAMKN